MTSSTIDGMTESANAIWTFIADFGDLAVIGPAFLAAACVLMLQGRRREAVLWGGGMLLCAAITLTLKMAVGSFHLRILDHAVTASSFPSGHAAMSVVFYGGLAALFWYAGSGLAGRLLGLALLLFETLIIASVSLLHWHPLIDIVSGIALGGAFVALLYPVAFSRPRPAGELVGIVLAVGLLAAALHGNRIDDRGLRQMLTTDLAAGLHHRG